MEIKITNEEQLADYKRELERMEFQYSGAQEQINKLRAAIDEYENSPARIAAGLSDKAKARLIFLGTGENSNEAVTGACRELRGKHLEEFSGSTPLGIKVLAELQKPKPSPERWGVVGNDSPHMLYCECLNPADAELMVAALFRYGLSTHVRKL